MESQYHINIKFDDIEIMNEEVYLFELHIGNKNTKMLKKLNQAFEILKFEESNENKKWITYWK